MENSQKKVPILITQRFPNFDELEMFPEVIRLLRGFRGASGEPNEGGSSG